jgi:hypothetical protein
MGTSGISESLPLLWPIFTVAVCEISNSGLTSHLCGSMMSSGRVEIGPIGHTFGVGGLDGNALGSRAF